MKKIKFTADKVTCEINNEENYYMIGFSDNGDEPNQYVILQKAIVFDNRDIKNRMNSYYFEYAGQSNSGYDICKNAKIEYCKVIFDLKEKTLDCIESIEIVFKQDALLTEWNELKNVFNEIFYKN